MDWKDVGAAISKWAPALGAALAPFTGGASGVIGAGIGAAAGAITRAFGLPDGATPDEVMTVITGDPEIRLKALIAENDFKLALKDRELKEIELTLKEREQELQDVQNARGREVQVKDSINRRLAYIVILSFILVVLATLMGWTKAESVLAGTLIGYLSAKAEQVLAYYFGSSKGSSEKTNLLARAPAIKE